MRLGLAPAGLSDAPRFPAENPGRLSRRAASSREGEGPAAPDRGGLERGQALAVLVLPGGIGRVEVEKAQVGVGRVVFAAELVIAFGQQIGIAVVAFGIEFDGAGIQGGRTGDMSPGKKLNLIAERAIIGLDRPQQGA